MSVMASSRLFNAKKSAKLSSNTGYFKGLANEHLGRNCKTLSTAFVQLEELLVDHYCYCKFHCATHHPCCERGMLVKARCCQNLSG